MNQTTTVPAKILTRPALLKAEDGLSKAISIARRMALGNKAYSNPFNH